MRPLSPRCIAAAAIAICTLAQVPPPAAAGETVKVGLVLALTGTAAPVGESIDRGARLYLKLHRAELPAGVDIELIRRDDGSDIDAARRIAQELIVRDHVQLLTGIALSPQAAAIASLATEAKIPVVLMNSTAARITRASPYFVRVSSSQWQGAYTAGQWAPAHGFRKVYILVSDYTVGLDTEAAFKKSFLEGGGEVVGQVHVPLGTVDFLPYMERLKGTGAQALFMFTNAGRMTTAAVKAFTDAGLGASGMALLGGGDIAPDDELGEMGDAALGMVTAGVYSAANPRPQNRAFVRAWQEAYGADALPNLFAAAGWDAMAAIFAVTKALDGKVTGDAAIDYLKHWHNPESPKGPIAIDPETRDIIQNVYLGRIEKVDGRLANVIFETIPAVKDPWKTFNP